MKDESGRSRRRIETPAERLSSLCGAILRISGSLDLDTVLGEIVDSARELTGAAHGTLTTIDEDGGPGHFLSSGTTPDEHEEMRDWADGPRLFEHLRDQPGPLRIADLPGYLRSLGFSTDVVPFKTAQGAPIHHRGVHVGSLFVAQKEPGHEFTDTDEEVLVLFASQAATAIANARAYRDEEQARARVEALVDTSPIGVVVFDARTGTALSFNREAKRIVEGLRLPERPPEQLLKAITCRWADGREIALAEFPMAQVLSTAKTIRNEEIELSVPDGRSVKTLLNVTPIHGPKGEVESVVVALQDLAPFEELERMRTELLAIVSHELRTPLTSIKGAAATVLGNSPGFSSVEMTPFFHIINEQADQMSGLIGDLLDAGRIATGTLSVSPEAADVAALVERARSTFLNGGGRHAVLVDLPEELPQATVDGQRIGQVLANLLANAAEHSPESSPIQISAQRDGAFVAISVTDQGKGIAPHRLPHLFRKSTTTDDGAGGLRGGLGLAICKGLVEAHGGRIRAESRGEGLGARFTFTVPVAGGTGGVAGAAGGAAETAGSAPDRGKAPRDGPARVPVLVVDDDPQTLRFVGDLLKVAGYAPVLTSDHRALSRLIHSEKPQLVLLDLMLSGADGIQLMEEVPELADLPVIFISAYGRDETIARALGAGAADYVVKPFSPTELTARVRAALRGRAEPPPFELGELAIHYERRRVTVAGRVVELTPTEFEVLRVLSINAGRVATYGSLQRQAWKRFDGTVKPKLVHALVKRLRGKLGESGDDAVYIRNVRGVGYRMPALAR